MGEQAPSYASPKLWPTDRTSNLLTGVKCRATRVAKKGRMLVLRGRTISRDIQLQFTQKHSYSQNWNIELSNQKLNFDLNFFCCKKLFLFQLRRVKNYNAYQGVILYVFNCFDAISASLLLLLRITQVLEVPDEPSARGTHQSLLEWLATPPENTQFTTTPCSLQHPAHVTCWPRDLFSPSALILWTMSWHFCIAWTPSRLGVCATRVGLAGGEGEDGAEGWISFLYETSSTTLPDIFWLDNIWKLGVAAFTSQVCQWQ